MKYWDIILLITATLLVLAIILFLAFAPAIVRAIRYAAALVGPEYVGLGSDFDGTVTTPFDTSELARLTEGLLDAGFTPTEIAMIMGGNVRRVLQNALPDDG